MLTRWLIDDLSTLIVLPAALVLIAVVVAVARALFRKPLPAAEEYRRLGARIELLWRVGRGESAEANALRDQRNDLWRRMTEKERWESRPLRPPPPPATSSSPDSPPTR